MEFAALFDPGLKSLEGIFILLGLHDLEYLLALLSLPEFERLQLFLELQTPDEQLVRQDNQLLMALFVYADLIDDLK